MTVDVELLGQVALGYSPLIDKQRNILGSRLTLFPIKPDQTLDVGQLQTVLTGVWPKGGKVVSLNVGSESLLKDLLQAVPDSNCIIEVPSFLAQDPDNAPALLALSAAKVPLMLKGRPSVALPKEVLGAFRFGLIDATEDRRGGEQGPEAAQRVIPTVQSGVNSLDSLEASFARGSVAVLGWPVNDLLARPLADGGKKAAADLQVMVKLIRQLDDAEDVSRLEGTLKQDPTLAFKLLRYINSPAFGLAVEVNSFSHAIMLLGYNRLKRWVALLLATSSKDPDMRPIMFAALRRGFMMEELGKLQGDTEVASELFICGVFSLLDRMFRQSFAELLDPMPLPERVKQALIHDEGPFAPYLHLVQAVENESLFEIKDAAQSLMLSMRDVNRALVQALGMAAQLD